MADEQNNEEQKTGKARTFNLIEYISTVVVQHQQIVQIRFTELSQMDKSKI